MGRLLSRQVTDDRRRHMVDTPSWLEGHVESLQIPALTTARYDCPVCGAKNTFSVTDDGLQRKWYCFHADCNVKGYTGVMLTSDNASSALRKAHRSPPRRRQTVCLKCSHICAVVTQHRCRVVSSQGWLLRRILGKQGRHTVRHQERSRRLSSKETRCYC